MKKSALNTTKICVSIGCSSLKKTLAFARKVELHADVIEIRLDTMHDGAVKPCIDEIKRPLLFTNRPVWEGGQFSGEESERLRRLKEATKAGAAYIDIELNTEESLRQELIKVAGKKKTKVIISWHDFSGTPSTQALAQIFQRQYRSGAHIGKIVTMARNFNDVLRVLNLQVEAHEMDFPLAAFCMGGPGMISRIATLELGGFMTYAAPDGAGGTAPGQLQVSALRSIMKSIRGVD